MTAKLPSAETELSRDEIARRDLHGSKCAGCNGRKKEEESFCKRCYFKLPNPVRSLLYKTFMEGYTVYYFNALEYLQALAAEKKAGRK